MTDILDVAAPSEAGKRLQVAALGLVPMFGGGLAQVAG